MAQHPDSALPSGGNLVVGPGFCNIDPPGHVVYLIGLRFRTKGPAEVMGAEDHRAEQGKGLSHVYTHLPDSTVLSTESEMPDKCLY